MINVKGAYNEANIYASIVEEAAVEQIRGLCDQEWAAGSNIAIMADVHAGAGCVIGTSMTLNGAVCPNLVGVDIGCGMLVVELGKIDVDFKRFDRHVHQLIPAGMNVHRKAVAEFPALADLIAPIKDMEYAVNSIGTLGGGNHFIELNADNSGNVYLVVHSGSRHLGIEVAKYWQGVAESEHPQSLAQMRAQLIHDLRVAGRQSEIEAQLKELAANHKAPNMALAAVTGANYEGYLHDMAIAQEYAALNRFVIAQRLVEAMGWHVHNSWETIHNYIDLEHNILRKGSVSAQFGEMLLIPMNMRDGSLVCRGKGNAAYNCTAPHGAGRLMSRAAARKNLDVSEFEREMAGIYSTTVGMATIDEAPMAYKPMEQIMADISNTVEVINVIKPIYNFKAEN